MEKLKLVKLFEMQKDLRDHIGYEGEDKKEKMLLALLVEVAECANEWRGFKYWSTKQEPRLEGSRSAKDALGAPVIEYYNPLLEEYVDGLHFVLDYGLEIYMNPERLDIRNYGPNESITKAFLVLNEIIIGLRTQSNGTFLVMHYEFLLSQYFLLGEMLGFSDDDIFYAYVEKNRINHKRQNEGY